MKTLLTLTSGRFIKAYTLLVTFTIMVACGTQESAEKTAKSNAPSIDIHTVAITGNLSALKKHIEAGTDINQKSPFGGSSPLISAIVFGKIELAKALIEAGADLSIQNDEGSTALHSAAFFGHEEMVRLLLEKGIDKTIKNKMGATALESVSGPFKDVKMIYDLLGKQLGPLGLEMDYEQIEKARPAIAELLK